MRIGADDRYQLTYCTNIHPGNGWQEVFETLQHYAPTLKAGLAREKLFGIGLRLSGEESRELLEGDRLQQFKQFLDKHDLYVFTINGFPYGPFHNQRVKENVHAPDWRDEERVQYTLRLIEILAFLLPEGMEGGISTSPLSYKRWVDTADPATWAQFTRNIVRVAERLVQVREEQGKLIHLDIEPEPDGLLENSRELVQFYREWLLPVGGRLLSESRGISEEEARAELLQYIRVCFDTCHVAVAFEDPEAVLDRLAEVGIRVGKIQVSSALKVAIPHDPVERTRLAQALEPFAESTYLHQVVQQSANGDFQQYPDLPDALDTIDTVGEGEWRIHFHVPIFIDRYEAFSSTQEDILRVFELLKERQFTPQLEIETYTWDVLPPGLKRELLDSIKREYEWVLDVFD